MTSPPTGTAAAAIRVVVATADPHQEDELRRLLHVGTLQPHVLVAAETVDAALRVVRDAPEGPPDCLIVDDGLADGNPTTLLAALRGPDGGCPCPVVVLTSDGAWAAGQAALRAGAQGLLGKGWTTAESLAQAIEHAVERQRMVTALREQSVALTGREAIEHALRRSEERLQLAILAGRAGTWDLDLVTGRNVWSEGHFTLLGLEPTPTREPGPGTWQASVLPEDLPSVVAAWAQAERGHGLFRSEHRLRRANDHEIIWVQALGRFFYDDGDRPVRFVGVFYDVTDRKRAQLALEDADRRKDECLATLAHELRNPLAPIRNGLEILRRLGPEDPMTAGTREMMERQLAHLVRLVDDLLDVSRMSRGVIELELGRVEVKTVLEHAAEASLPVIEAGHHTLTITPPPEPVWVNGDLTRLAQVVGNLLNNAAKYTPHGGRIRLTGAMEAGEAIIRVADDGMGIPADMLHGVFEMFAQVDRTPHRSLGGLGIGLSIVRRLVELHGGTITAESPGLGHGSTFTVHLPLAPAAEDEPSARARESPPGPVSTSRGPGRRVLIVDDNIDGAETLAMVLELHGHATKIAGSGQQALDLARAFEPAVVLLDIGMPGMDGHEVARRLRADPATAHMALVALTGWGTEDDQEKSKAAGFDVHLIKPVEPAVLVDTLARLAAGRG